MDAKKFLSQPENLLRLGFFLLIAAQANNVVNALSKSWTLFIWVQTFFLLAMIMITFRGIRHRKRHSHQVDMKGARVVFVCFALLAFVQYL